MSKFKPVRALSSTVSSFPKKAGQVIFVEDALEIWWDPTDTNRVQVRDVIVLETEAERQTVLAPLSKFYYIIETNALWRFGNDGEWHKVSDILSVQKHINNEVLHITVAERTAWNEKAKKAAVQTVTLNTSGWGSTGPDEYTGAEYYYAAEVSGVS